MRWEPIEKQKRIAGRVYHGREMARLLALLSVIVIAFAAVACSDSKYSNKDASPKTDASSTATLSANPSPTLSTLQVSYDSGVFTAELADDPAERAQGLSDRDVLASGTGMLFVFDEVDAHQLWMKGMRFALDFIWLDGGKTVIEITRDVPPQPGATDAELTRYSPAAPSRYVIELNAGDAERLRIKVGVMLGFDAVGGD